MLRDQGVDVRLFMGASQPGEEAEPATQLDVLTELLGRDYDLVHTLPPDVRSVRSTRLSFRTVPERRV